MIFPSFCLPAASLAILSVGMGAQTAASPQISAMIKTGEAQIQATSLSAELTKGIDTKKAMTGDAVNARTISEARLPDGTLLPKGTRLMGNVIEVTSKSKEQKNAHLVISLTHAIIKDGQDMPIRAAVTSVTTSMMPASMDTLSSAGGGVSSGTGGGASTGSATTPAPSVPPLSDGGSNAQVQQGAMLKSAQDRVPVGGMPHVILSAPTTPQCAGVLDAEDQNISLQSGTRLTINISPGQGGL